MANPNLPSNYFLPGADGQLFQILSPDGRVVVNFLPANTARTLLIDLQAMYPWVKFTYQPMPADQLI